MKHGFRDDLEHNRTRIGIWGSGYIGLTSGINFALNGVHALCYDTDPRVMEEINKGKISIPNLEYWLGFPIESLVKDGLLRATSDWKDLMKPDVQVHLVAIPTEKQGEPWDVPLRDVMSKLASRKPDAKKPLLVIIESTLTPNDVEEIIVKILAEKGHAVGKHILIGVAPRRDWFHSPEKNLKNLPRVIAGTTPETTAVLKDVLSIVCDRLITASDHKIAELVKSVENSLLHVPSLYAIQLARAYPNVNIMEVFELAATHWRIPLYYPSVGTGGYCIPLSTKYVIKGAKSPEIITIGKEAIRWDADQPRFIAQLLDRKSNGPVGILGITYKGDLKVHTLSPALTIIKYLKELGREVLVHDPYYTEKELKDLTGCAAFAYPQGLAKLGAIVIVPSHRMYTQTPKSILLKALKRGTAIIDNVGTWEKFRDDFSAAAIDYHRVGDRNWCV